MAHAPRHVPEQIAPDLEDGETLVAATEADHRSSGGAAIGFVFSGLFSNVVSKAEEGDGGDEQLHLPYGPVVVAVTDKRILLYSRDLNLENGDPKLVVAVPFTPATGPRLLVRPDLDRATASSSLLAALDDRPAAERLAARFTELHQSLRHDCAARVAAVLADECRQGESRQDEGRHDGGL